MAPGLQSVSRQSGARQQQPDAPAPASAMAFARWKRMNRHWRLNSWSRFSLPAVSHLGHPAHGDRPAVAEALPRASGLHTSRDVATSDELICDLGRNHYALRFTQTVGLEPDELCVQGFCIQHPRKVRRLVPDSRRCNRTARIVLPSPVVVAGRGAGRRTEEQRKGEQGVG